MYFATLPSGRLFVHSSWDIGALQSDWDAKLRVGHIYTFLVENDSTGGRSSLGTGADRMVVLVGVAQWDKTSTHWREPPLIFQDVETPRSRNLPGRSDAFAFPL